MASSLFARLVLALGVIALCCVTGSVAQQQVCNNAAALCARTYDNVTHLGAHDSPFVRNKTNSYTIAGDQIYTTVQQLDAGVRLVSAQVHAVTGNGQTQWRLCHSLCQLYDAGSLVDWLKEIKDWLDRNTNDVITILLVNSDNANATTLGNIYQQAGLDAYSYQPSSTTERPSQWPTLGEMISQKKRVVNFVANLDPTANQAAPYLLDEFTFVFENNYENLDPAGFTCEPSRPASVSGQTQSALSAGYLPLMNHFLYTTLGGIEISAVDSANVTNAPSGAVGNLGDAATNCSRIYGRAPPFILVDFVNVGPAIETIDRMNGVQGQTTGRFALPDTIADSMANPNPSSSGGGGGGASSTTTRPGSSSTPASTTSSTGAVSSSPARNAAARGTVTGPSAWSLSIITYVLSLAVGVLVTN